jgi:hypothetical protein
LDGEAVLNALATVPIERRNYKWDSHAANARRGCVLYQPFRQHRDGRNRHC